MSLRAGPTGREPGGVLLLWNGEARAADTRGNVVLWQGSATAPNQRSLVAFLEARAGEVRRRYLVWAHDLGDTLVMGRRIRDRLASRDGSSLWVQSLFFEQSTWKQDSLDKLLKLLALELLLDEQRPAALEFAGADSALDTVLRCICKQRGISYASRRLAARQSWTWPATLRALPSVIGAVAALGRFALRSYLLGSPAVESAISGEGRVLICGPFFNYNVDASTGRDFTSSYWGALPEALAAGNRRI